MQVGQFPASAANSLIEGYCDDFVALAALLAQTLEQVSMRGIGFDKCRPHLQRIENGMRELAAGIHEMLERGSLSTKFDSVRPGAAPAAAPVAGAATPSERPAASVPPTPSTPMKSPIRSGPEPKVEPDRAMRRPDLAPRGPSPAQPQPVAQQLQPRTAAGPAPSPTPTAKSAPPPRPTTPRAEPAPAPTTRRPADQERIAAPAEPKAPTADPAMGKSDVLRGTNRTMPLQSVFQFLGRTRKSGTLHVFIGEEIVAFEFVNGCIEFTATNHCPMAERLGELLVELGFCTRDRLAPILAKVGVSSANRLGQLVIDEHLVSNGQVLEALEAQVLRRFQRVCECTDASYEFEPGRRVPGDGRIRIAPFELTIDQPWKLRQQ